MKLRLKEMADAGEGLGASPLLLAAAIGLVSLFGWSLAIAAETTDNSHKKIEVAQLYRPSAQEAGIQANHGATDQERALFIAPASMVPHRSDNSLPEGIYEDTGRLGSGAE